MTAAGARQGIVTTGVHCDISGNLVIEGVVIPLLIGNETMTVANSAISSGPESIRHSFPFDIVMISF
jgi:hypothetical protein